MKALILYPQYGFANRLRALASARILADYAGRRLFVNWMPSETDCNVSWEELFVNPVEHYPLPLSSFQNSTDIYVEGSRDFDWNMPQSLAQNKSEVVAIRTCRNFKPKEMTDEAFIRAKSLFYKSLIPISSIKETVSDVQRQYFNDNYVVGVHIRRTDSLSYLKLNPNKFAPTELFIRKMRHVLRNNPRTKFFLATDDKNDEQIIRNLFQDAIIVYEKKSINRSTKLGMQDALVDWLLLSASSEIIGSYMSSFDAEACIVNMIKRETIPRRATLIDLKAHYNLYKAEGLRKVLLYSYYFRKGRILERIKDYFSKKTL